MSRLPNWHHAARELTRARTLVAGAWLAGCGDMMKSLFVVALLAAPAFADQKTMQLGFTLSAGNETRHYAMKLVTDACGGIEARAPDERDEIKVCAQADGGNNDVRLEVDWTTKHGDHELKNRSTVLATRGQSFELDGGVAKLTVALQ
jgi:hypothetical protein